MGPAHISHSSFKKNFDTGHLLESSKTVYMQAGALSKVSRER